MTPPDQGGLSYRVSQLEKRISEQNEEIGKLRESVNTVGNRILYAVAAGALAFAFSVLQLVG